MANSQDSIGGRLPPASNTSCMLAMLYKRLGGSFSIGTNGVRYFGHPEPCLFRMLDQPLPQLAGTKPHEQFHNESEWRGALKLVEALLQRLDDHDSDLVFDLFATISVDDRNLSPSIEEPRRPSTC